MPERTTCLPPDASQHVALSSVSPVAHLKPSTLTFLRVRPGLTFDPTLIQNRSCILTTSLATRASLLPTAGARLLSAGVSDHSLWLCSQEVPPKRPVPWNSNPAGSDLSEDARKRSMAAVQQVAAFGDQSGVGARMLASMGFGTAGSGLGRHEQVRALAGCRTPRCVIVDQLQQWGVM